MIGVEALADVAVVLQARHFGLKAILVGPARQDGVHLVLVHHLLAF